MNAAAGISAFEVIKTFRIRSTTAMSIAPRATRCRSKLLGGASLADINLPLT
jgi:hypothetical protein